jgi:hypothetical protein
VESVYKYLCVCYIYAARSRYAEDDVVYLAQVADDLSRQLEERGRLRWFEEECAKLGTPAYYKELLRIPDELFPRLKKVKSLSGPERSAPQPSVHPPPASFSVILPFLCLFCGPWHL